MDTEELNTYDVVGQTQQKTITQDTSATLTPARDEASKKEDNFYDAEEHTYAVVKKKKKRNR